MSKLKFKAGDKVVMVRADNEENEYKERIGKTGTIKKIWIDIGVAEVIWDDGKHCRMDIPFLKNLELVQPKQFTKADLKDDDKITLVNGDSFYYKNGSFTNYFYSSYDDELKRIDNLSEREIARIERPNYETVYERVEEPAKKMTVADIQKELGYKVEIVE